MLVELVYKFPTSQYTAYIHPCPHPPSPLSPHLCRYLGRYDPSVRGFPTRQQPLLKVAALSLLPICKRKPWKAILKWRGAICLVTLNSRTKFIPHFQPARQAEKKRFIPKCIRNLICSERW